MARLLLDTGILVAAYRGTRYFADHDDVALPAVAEAEFLLGVLCDPDPARQAAQRGFLDEVLAVVPVIDYTREIAAAHAELLAHVRRVGQPRGAHGLMIAATACATDRVLVTTDCRAHFDELPGVEARVHS